MGAYQALKELVDYKRKTQQEFVYDNYYVKCGEMMLNQQEYDVSSAEDSFLYSLYFLYETKLYGGELGDIFRDSKSVEFQRDFYTKLFIYDKINQIEKENGENMAVSVIIYKDFVVELNTTTNIDGEQTPKRAMDMFQDFAKKELKEDQEFLDVINTFCNSEIKMTFTGGELAPVYPLFPTTEEEEKSTLNKEELLTSNKKQGKVIQFCKKISK